MSLDLPLFLNRDAIIFFLICFAILTVIIGICFVVIRSIFRFIKSLLKKKTEAHTIGGMISDKGEDLAVYVEELEESKKERARVQGKKQQGVVAPGPVVQYSQQVSGKQTKEEVQIDKEREWAEKKQKDIETDLGRLKDSKDSNVAEESFLERQAESEDDNGPSPKIKIPVAKRPTITSGAEGSSVPQAPIDGKNQATTPGKISTAKTNRIENFKKYDVKIDKGILPKSLEALAKVRASEKDLINNQTGNEKTSLKEKPEFIKESSKTNQKDKVKVLGQKDTSVFEGKGEISRANLREKLRKDSAILKAGREVGLNMSPVERAKLEKQVFSQSFGGNISKTDLKWGLKKLNDKLLNAKSPTEHAKIRKEIKFFKKIGGIK